MFERVVVGVDFGASSRDAVQWVARHLAPERLVLAHAVRPLRPPAYLSGSLVDVDAVTRREQRNATTAMESLIAELSLDAEPHIAVGDPANTLETAALEHEADLIVLGEHGRHRYAWPALGRTTFALMARAKLPVLFARALPSGLPRSLLVAHGAGPESTELIATARALQKAWDARALLLHVVDRAFLPSQPADSPDIDPRSLQREIEREAAEWLGELRRRARVRAADIPIQIALGEPAAELMATLHRTEHDLLIVRGSALPTPAALPDRVSRVLMTSAPVPILRLPGSAA